MSVYSGIWPFLSPLLQAFKSIDATLTFLIIFGLVMAMAMAVFSWTTPPNPKWLNAVGVGAGVTAFVLFGIYNYVPLAPALIHNSINGLYGYPGYIWVGSLIILTIVFAMNTFDCWAKDKPLEVFQ